MAKLTPRAECFLMTVARLGLCIPDQVNRCHYARGCRTSTYSELLALSVARYLKRAYVRDPNQPHGNARVAYKLANRGRRFLVGHHLFQPNDLVIPSDNRSRSYAPLLHLIEANEPIVLAHELMRLEAVQIGRACRFHPRHEQDVRPALTLQFMSELQLRRQPIKSGAFTLIPDAWVRIARPPQSEAVFCIEWDRSSIKLAEIRARLHAYLRIDQSEEYAARFGTKTLRVVWITPDFKRREALRQVAEQVLGFNHPQADLFLFGTWGRSDPLTFYFQPIWQMLGGERVSLLPARWKEDGWLKDR